MVEHLLYRGSEVINAGDSEVKNADVTEELICYPMTPKAFKPHIGHHNVTPHSDTQNDTG